ncbi:CRISPR-associated helicase Cas3' [Enterobacter chengduensis]|uniref:CRISPR-associated helicase Cas3' n=1 Tax=Enterobacter chengduensis TaxID=2494701 RepID=UPI0020067D6D|nr:CRISPR-associated helicase Cas3' [Enterobacter chengduensis]MCK7429287.1 CRISPR-associated helicase Cas3' [Enterobacter chengduensis]
MGMFKYWGKSRLSDKEGGDDYHLLCWHALDVAACGYWIVQQNVYGVANLFRQSGLPNREQAAQFFAWLLCWHDTGKFAHSFQQRYVHPALNNHSEKPHYYEDIHHTTLGYWLWQNTLREKYELFPASALTPRKLRRVLERWMPLTLGHHGLPPGMADELIHFRQQDKNAACDFLQSIKTLFPLLNIPERWDREAESARFRSLSWSFSGVIVLADWLGSSTHYFPRIASEMPLDSYWRQALAKAERAVKSLPTSAKVAPFGGINRLFPFIQHPTPLQQKALELDISAEGPQLFILEDITGAGKTEAAMILTHRLMAAGKAQGIYFGLPTMATANAMFRRMSESCLALYQPGSRPSLMLAHSARNLVPEFNSSLWSVDASDEEDRDGSQSQGCAAWFADSNKKALLADIGVGTLDQAMMAVMPFKHNNLRLLGLHRKVLLADEIHACDAYISFILECLIEKQARDGNPTILLSATLSQQQRERLVAAFLRGAGGAGEAPRLGHDDYPWLTQATAAEVISTRVGARKEVERSVSVAWLYSEQDCITLIQQAVRNRKCVAWVRNSVDDAIRSRRQLIASGAREDDTLLFHSRFAFHDRQRIENQTLDFFGKHSGPERAGKVIIATQVIEQSLDIDVDLMISDLAPVDLLIQRAGRLQRHIRDCQGRIKETGRDERPAPELFILAPEWNDNPTETWFSGAMRNSAYVYPDHGKLWLTQRILRTLGEILMPQAARQLIESVYGDEIGIPDGLVNTSDRSLGKYYCDRAIASQRTLNLAAGYLPGIHDYLPEKLSTRLAEESVLLWLAKKADDEVVPYAPGENGWEMSALKVRESWWRKHRSQFSLLEGEELQAWCAGQRKDPEFAVVIVVSDSPACGYSSHEGLTSGN